jgi:7-carboxy-7-deazaguanine synthase
MSLNLERVLEIQSQDENAPLEAKLKITEIFHSIQGESTRSGERTVFIRLTGCPLRCNYCDTTYSYTGGEWKSVKEILQIIDSFQSKYICVTGGEPLAQPKVIHLIRELNKLDYKTSIETDGEEDVSQYIGLAKIILDVKTPDSGENAKKCFENLNYLLSSDEIKFVLCSLKDYEWAKQICKKYDLENRFTVLFSPSYTTFSFKDLAEKIIKDRLKVRLQLQLHKIIWGKETTGV